MRVFLWVSGVLGGAVALAFTVALLRDRPSAREALPPALIAGASLTAADAADAFRAWVSALPTAPRPLTTRYELRAEYLDEELGLMRGEVDLGVMNGSFGDLRLDVMVRSAKDGGEFEDVVHGTLVLDSIVFSAWGRLPFRPELEPLTFNKVVRLPTELLTAIFQEGLFQLEGLGIPTLNGTGADREISIGEWFHPARLSSLLMKGSLVSAMTVEEDVLGVTIQGGSAALSLLSLAGVQSGLPELETIAQTPLEMKFDVDTGELLNIACTLPTNRGWVRVDSVHRESSAPESAFKAPEGMAVFDLSGPAQIGLNILRNARTERSEAEF